MKYEPEYTDGEWFTEKADNSPIDRVAKGHTNKHLTAALEYRVPALERPEVMNLPMRRPHSEEYAIDRREWLIVDVNGAIFEVGTFGIASTEVGLGGSGDDVGLPPMALSCIGSLAEWLFACGLRVDPGLAPTRVERLEAFIQLAINGGMTVAQNLEPDYERIAAMGGEL